MIIEQLKAVGSEIAHPLPPWPPSTAPSRGHWGLKHILGDSQKRTSRGLYQKAWVAVTPQARDPSHTNTHLHGIPVCIPAAPGEVSWGKYVTPRLAGSCCSARKVCIDHFDFLEGVPA